MKHILDMMKPMTHSAIVYVLSSNVTKILNNYWFNIKIQTQWIVKPHYHTFPTKYNTWGINIRHIRENLEYMPKNTLF